MYSRKITFLVILAFSFILSTSSAVQGQNLNNISASSILENISNGKDVIISNSVIIGELNFGKLNKTNLKLVSKYIILNPECFIENEVKEENITVIGNKISITNSIFENDVNISSNEFTENLDFRDSKFKGTTNFNEALFRYPVQFYNAEFYNDTDFRCTRFGGTAGFMNATFYKQAHFRRAEFESYSNFANTNFYQLVRFNATKFIGPYSDFTSASFRDDAIFEFATFVNKVDFSYANFKNPVYFLNTKFYIVSFNNTNFTRLSLDETDFKTINVRWSNIKNVNLDEITYLKLIRNFKEIGQYNDANDAYYQYRIESEAIEKSKKQYVPWLFEEIWRISCGYGVKPQNAIILSVMLILFFSFFYFPRNSKNLIKDAIFSIYLSSLIFFSIESKDSHPVHRYEKIAYIIERVSGWFILTLFIVTLTNVMIRS